MNKTVACSIGLSYTEELLEMLRRRMCIADRTVHSRLEQHDDITDIHHIT
jgi:hypothetical protein